MSKIFNLMLTAEPLREKTKQLWETDKRARQIIESDPECRKLRSLLFGARPFFEYAILLREHSEDEAKRMLGTEYGIENAEAVDEFVRQTEEYLTEWLEKDEVAREEFTKILAKHNGI